MESTHQDGPTPDPAAQDPADAEAEAAQLEKDLDAFQRERDELLDTTRRLQAAFENYRKRVLREQTALVERATEGLLEQLLPVLDSFELAVHNLQAGDVDEKVRKGIELAFAELVGVLERAGLERIDAHGAVFDPNQHEAVMQDEGDGEPHVGDVLRTGWRLSGRVLRPAMVKVTKN
ncbi:MAG TPA: nucleotide exchange factor GrpE [Acidimicrobiia bacterium]|nr:nucleotide exchange factor GrpE [Acidimicrobiia bacterium]